nr:hypothetical protein [Tanacetum cinerariifolium]
MLTNQIDWANPEGDQVRIDISKPLPLSGPPVRTHMRTLSVVSIKAYSRYRYDYLKEITLRRADYQEYTIAEKDFKNLYPSDFEDLNMLFLQDFQLDIESYQKQLNLTKPGWDAKGFEYKHDYTIIESPRAVVFPVGNNEWKIMRFNEIYKLSDVMLTNIMEALDYRVKDYKVQVKMEIEIPHSSRVYFITACSYSTDTSKELMKVQVTVNNQAFIIKKSMSMSVQLSQAQDGETSQVNDPRLDLADDLKEAQVHISSSITSHETKITTSMYKISHEESKTTSCTQD